MVGYRRIGSVEQHLGNATSTTLLLQLRGLWKSPRGAVLRIEALALVAIILSFFLAFFGSCHRWSNRWIVQKGFLAAHVLSLSLGTYSTGLMQSSSVKSEMYPIWAVSLLTLSGCIDQVTSYIGLDYKGPLSKMIFQLCLYCGYVLLMCFSTISGVAVKLAIGMLSAITFVKVFHRSMALVHPSRIRDKIGSLESTESGALVGINAKGLMVHLESYTMDRGSVVGLVPINMAEIYSSSREMLSELPLEVTADNKITIENVCLGYSLSHLLQRRFLKMDNVREMEVKRREFGTAINYKRTLKAIEIELAFLYEVFFTSNEFLHFYQPKGASIWAFASFIGICFVGIATSVPGTIASQHRLISSTGPDAGTVVIETTIGDLIITLAILASLALLQLVQLIRCWTSNWATVAFACKYSRNKRKMRYPQFRMYRYSRYSLRRPTKSWRPWMRLKAFVVTRMNWFDKYLWQDKLGQYSLVDEKNSRRLRSFFMWPRFLLLLGVHYVIQVLWELLWARNTSKPAVRLHDDVKTSIADFLGSQVKSIRIGKKWWSLFVDNGLDTSCLPYSNAPLLSPFEDGATMSEAYAFTHRVMMWHIATWYCELAEEQERGRQSKAEVCSEAAAGGGDAGREKNRCVANALSKYCAYLVVSAPELLVGSATETKRSFKDAASWTRRSKRIPRNRLYATLREESLNYNECAKATDSFSMGVYWGRWLRNELQSPLHYQQCPQQGRCSSDPWEVLALLWAAANPAVGRPGLKPLLQLHTSRSPS